MTALKHLGLPSESQNNYEPTLDGWRAMAILLVLYEHFVGYTMFDMGRMGVNAFFALSGALMGGILFVRKTPLKTFYQRRFTRVFPLFFLFVAVVYGTGALMGNQESENVLYTIAFLRSYLPEGGIWGTDLPIGHLWSLNIEEHAYVIMSVIALFGVRLRRDAWSPCLLGSVLIGVGLVSIVAKYVTIKFMPASQGVGLQTHLNLGFIFIAAGYHVWYRHYQWRINNVTWWVAAAIAIGFIVHIKSMHWFAMTLVAPFMFAFAVNHLSEISGALKSLFSYAWLRLVGLWSFSLYIWQQPFYVWSKQHDDGVVSLLLFSVVVVISLLSFYVFENPLRVYLNKKMTGRR